jgi:hypothetical protein
MEFDQMIRILTEQLVEKNPDTFSSSWILKHAPRCYRFIHKNIRTESGHIDWDRITFALKWKFQRRWVPRQKTKKLKPYANHSEVNAVLDKYPDKLYVFVSPLDQNDMRIRDIISISLVRLAQRGNIAAKREVTKLVQYTTDNWLERYNALARWRGYRNEVQEQIEACVRRYRYSGSFLYYVFRTLEYAGRGLPPIYIYSLDEPIFVDSKRQRIENVIQDSETNEIRMYRRSNPCV